MKKKLITRRLLIISFTLLASGCVRKKDCMGFDMQYSDWLHYNLNDQIVFKDQNNNTRIYTVTKKYITSPYQEKWSDWSGKEIPCSAGATLEAWGEYIANGQKEVKRELHIYMNEYSDSTFNYSLEFGNGTSLGTFQYAPAISFYDGSYQYHDSLFLNGKWYYSVIEKTFDTLQVTSLETWKWYFSRSNGFIGFKDRSCNCDFFSE